MPADSQSEKFFCGSSFPRPFQLNIPTNGGPSALRAPLPSQLFTGFIPSFKTSTFGNKIQIVGGHNTIFDNKFSAFQESILEANRNIKQVKKRGIPVSPQIPSPQGKLSLKDSIARVKNESQRNTENTHTDNEVMQCQEEKSVEIVEQPPQQKKGISFKDPTPTKLNSESRRLKAEEMMKKRIDVVQKDVLIKERERELTQQLVKKPLQLPTIPIIPGTSSASKNAYFNILEETERQKEAQLHASKLTTKKRPPVQNSGQQKQSQKSKPKKRRRDNSPTVQIVDDNCFDDEEDPDFEEFDKPKMAAPLKKQQWKGKKRDAKKQAISEDAENSDIHEVNMELSELIESSNIQQKTVSKRKKSKKLNGEIDGQKPKRQKPKTNPPVTAAEADSDN
ncbi:hypothetical protein FGO68_gene7365 [Halteria grandinella]|uniref:Uncharacterized protein n=1 Tax=Halteria grandinella TaxID=5974 RepID=A0A8J8NF47_HALGN|nr:hypothetical protein FGO68_gene7365 [Halteria grandinella]